MTVASPSINNLKASDNTTEAVRAVVTSIRSVASTVIQVNSVVGYPSNFIGMTGALDANNQLTIRPQVFFGHLSGSNIEIDSFAPGYTDQGNEVGDIVILKPTTPWADEVAAILGVAHSDDGTLKANSVVTDNYTDTSVTPAKRSGGFAAGSFVSPSSTGNYSVTTLDFTPRLVKFSVSYASSDSARTFGAIGHMDEDGNQGRMSWTATSTNNQTRSGTDSCIVGYSTPAGTFTLELQGSYVSMNSNGFTVNFTSANSSYRVFWEAYA